MAFAGVSFGVFEGAVFFQEVRKVKIKRKAQCFSSLLFFIQLFSPLFSPPPNRNRCRAALLILLAGVVVFLTAKVWLKNEGGRNAGAAREVSPPLFVSPPPPLASASASTASASAAAAASISSLHAAASDAKHSAPVAPKHANEISSDLGSLEKAQKGDGSEASSLAENVTAAVAGAAAAAAAATSAAETKAAAAADDAELLALRSRIFSQQSPTEDTTPHGAAGRAARVASLREAAVSAELEYRRSRRPRSSEDGASGLSSPISRSLFPPAPLGPSHRDYVAVCVVMKDQNVDIPEFVAWHAALGVRNFYLFDHGSSPPVSAREAAAMLPAAARNETRVLVTPLTEADIAAHSSRIPQMTAYDACAAAHRAKHEWLGFLDVDEFVVISPNSTFASSSSSSSSSSASASSASSATTATTTVPSLPLLLSRYEGAAAALTLHWSMFGSGGRASRKPDSMLTAEAFEACLPRDNGNNRHIKTIAATRMLDIAEPCLGAHHFAYWDFEGAVEAAEAAAAVAAGEEKKGGGGGGVVVAEAAADASANASAVSSSSSPSFARRPQPFAVDVEGARIDGPYSRVPPGESPPRVPHAPAFLAHYVLKSKEEYKGKVLRGDAMNSGKGWSFFDEVERLSTERCLEAAALAKRIKPRMKMTP